MKYVLAMPVVAVFVGLMWLCVTLFDRMIGYLSWTLLIDKELLTVRAISFILLVAAGLGVGMTLYIGRKIKEST